MKEKKLATLMMPIELYRNAQIKASTMPVKDFTKYIIYLVEKDLEKGIK